MKQLLRIRGITPSRSSSSTAEATAAFFDTLAGFHPGDIKMRYVITADGTVEGTLVVDADASVVLQLARDARAAFSDAVFEVGDDDVDLLTRTKLELPSLLGLLLPALEPRQLPLNRTLARLSGVGHHLLVEVTATTVAPSEIDSMVEVLRALATMADLEDPGGGRIRSDSIAKLVGLVEDRQAPHLMRASVELGTEGDPDAWTLEVLRQCFAGVAAGSHLPLLNLAGLAELRDEGSEWARCREVLHATNVGRLLQLPVVSDERCSVLPVTPSRVLEATRALPAEGLLVGTAVHRGHEVPLRLRPEELDKHLHVIGQTGAGKSTIIESLIAAAVERNDRAIFFLDPHGDSAERILHWLDPAHAPRAYFVDFGNTDHSVGINLLRTENEVLRQRSIGEIEQTFRDMYGDIWGPRRSDVFRNTCELLAADPDGTSTLLDVLWTFDLNDSSNMAWAKRVIASDPIRHMSLQCYVDGIVARRTGDGSLKELSAYLRSTLSPLIDIPHIRNVVGQATNTMDFRRMMEERAIVFFDLASDQVSQPHRQLIGRVVIAQLFQEVLRSGELPKAQRPEVMLVLDEAGDFGSPTLSHVLSSGRKFGASLTLAHQWLDQLLRNGHDFGSQTNLRDAVLSNAQNVFCFRTSTACPK